MSKKSLNRILFLFTLIIALVALAACGGAATPAPAAEQPAAEEPAAEEPAAEEPAAEEPAAEEPAAEEPPAEEPAAEEPAAEEPAPTEEAAAEEPAAEEPFEVVMGIAASVGELHPNLTSLTTDWIILEQIMDPLIYLGPDGTFQPWLATEWEVSEDGLTWTFKLREDVTFHNGEPV